MIKMDRMKLLTIQKMIKENKAVARVGIMGSGNARGAKTLKQALEILEAGDTLTNAEIGLWHEFGTTRMKQRSFLRMPLALKLREYVRKSNALKPAMMTKCYEERSMVPLLKRIGVISRGIILEAFDTGGFGRWAPLSPYTLSRKKLRQILVETQDLRNSIVFEVVK
jgi:hypothetical protein